jgi:K+-transporting ATPase ATPase C chain
MDMKQMLLELRTALIATFSLAVILCAFYPLLVWALGQGLFPEKANGSLLMRDGEVIGSELLAQDFRGSKYFHPRPSAAGAGYDATQSGGSNLGPLSKKLVDSVRQRVLDYRMENRLAAQMPVPADAVTASASGLDPHISLANALLQTPRVARLRGLSEETVRKQIALYTEDRDWGVFGEPRVNVLMLNLALDGLAK